MYDLYKPFRNYMRRFPLAESLEKLWLFASHLSASGPHSGGLRFRDKPGLTFLKDTVFPWDLELLAREIILHAGSTGDKSFSRWSDLARAINFIRDIENKIAERQELDSILRDLNRLIHRQFPWRRPPSTTSIMRYLKIFGGGELEAMLEKQTGLPLRKFYKLSFAVSGHLLKSAGVNMATNYSVLNVTPTEGRLFFQNLSATRDELQKRTALSQTYDDGWTYAWNPLQATPLVSFDTAYPERAYCPIPVYMLRRVTDGLFYDLVKLPSFDNAFGSAFQTYVGAVLHAVLKPPSFAIAAEDPYQLAKGYRKHGVDWTLTDETANVFIECKTKRLRWDAKFIVSGTGLSDAMDALGGYIVQHYKNIIDAMAGRTRWTPNDRPSYALVVTMEDWSILMPDVVKMLDTSVARRFTEANLDHGLLDQVPCVVASADDLEIASQVIAQTGIQGFFGMKMDREHRGWAISPFFSKFPNEMKRANRHLFAKEFLDFGTGLTEGLR